MAATFREHGMGVIVDFVPNHMGVGGADNVFWLSVLEWGRQSPVADWFDIDWDSATPGLAGKVLMPFLGDQYGEVLAQGGMELRYEPDRGAFAIWAHDTHKLPISPQTYATILRAAPGFEELAAAFEAAGAAEPSDPVWPDLRRRLRDTDPTPAVEASAARPAISTAGPRSTGWPRRRTGARPSSRWTVTRSTTAASSP